MISKTKIKKKIRNKTNTEVSNLVRDLMKQKKKLWLDVAKYIAKPKGKAVSVNIEKINKLSKGNEIIIVPGKVLAEGNLEHNIILAALKYSKDAREKLSQKASIMTIPELIKKYNEFKNINVRIII